MSKTKKDVQRKVRNLRHLLRFSSRMSETSDICYVSQVGLTIRRVPLLKALFSDRKVSTFQRTKPGTETTARNIYEKKI